MKCDICHSNEASVFLSKVVNGKSQNLNVCHDCAEEKGVTDSAEISIFDQIFNENIDNPNEIECENCGFTQSDLKRTARLGCSQCYDSFEKELDKMIAVMHKDTTHCGKIPKNFKNTKPITKHRNSIKDLEKKLSLAIKEERFEDAACIRDEINTIETI